MQGLQETIEHSLQAESPHVGSYRLQALFLHFLKDFQRNSHIKLGTVRLCDTQYVTLKRREVVMQIRHAIRKTTMQLDFASEKVHRRRQTRGGEDFLLEIVQQ